MIIEDGMHKISESSVATALEGLSLLKKQADRDIMQVSLASKQ